MRKVEFAKLKGVNHHPKTGNFGPALTAKATSTSKATEMYFDGEFVTVRIPGKEQSGAKIQVSLTFPIESFDYIELAAQKNEADNKTAD